MEDVVQALKSAGEPTRLRMLVILSRGELTVTELCRVLGQSQPRVSRHLRLLTDSGLLERHTEGVHAFYRPARSGLGGAACAAATGLVSPDDPTLLRDLERLDEIKQARAESAAAYFASVADEWDVVRGLHVDEGDVEAALLDVVGSEPIEQLLDIGTGTGRILDLLADRFLLGVGIDSSPAMLNVARSRLDDETRSHCLVRHGDAYDLAISLEPGTFDVATLHHVLHFLEDPGRALAEAAAVLKPQGRLVIVDFAEHDEQRLRADFAHRWSGFSDDTIRQWCLAAGLSSPTVKTLPPPAGTGRLTTKVWTSVRAPDLTAEDRIASDEPMLEVAS